MILNQLDINKSVQETWKTLAQETNSYLIDVRTMPEWNFAGYPDLSSIRKTLITVSWLIYPVMNVNHLFNEELAPLIDKSDKLFFICKTGGRSLNAALEMINLGYNNCYNVIHGFEGDQNSSFQRGHLNGWKAENLPWRQS